MLFPQCAYFIWKLLTAGFLSRKANSQAILLNQLTHYLFGSQGSMPLESSESCLKGVCTLYALCVFPKEQGGRPEVSTQGLKMATIVHSSNYSTQEDDSFDDEMAG